MQQETIDKLIKYICMAIPYNLMILHETWNYEWDDELSLLERVVGIDDKFIYTKVIDDHTGEEYRDDEILIDSFDDKIYLRSLSSMTDNEKEEYKQLINNYNASNPDSALNVVNWMLEHHFNINLPEHLIIEADKEFNPYTKYNIL